jgi:hypothetical protein
MHMNTGDGRTSPCETARTVALLAVTIAQSNSNDNKLMSPSRSAVACSPPSLTVLARVKYAITLPCCDPMLQHLRVALLIEVYSDKPLQHQHLSVHGRRFSTRRHSISASILLNVSFVKSSATDAVSIDARRQS